MTALHTYYKVHLQGIGTTYLRTHIDNSYVTFKIQLVTACLSVCLSVSVKCNLLLCCFGLNVTIFRIDPKLAEMMIVSSKIKKFGLKVECLNIACLFGLFVNCYALRKHIKHSILF